MRTEKALFYCRKYFSTKGLLGIHCSTTCGQHPLLCDMWKNCAGSLRVFSFAIKRSFSEANFISVDTTRDGAADQWFESSQLLKVGVKVLSPRSTRRSSTCRRSVQIMRNWEPHLHVIAGAAAAGDKFPPAEFENSGNEG
jgi:hypothetical protein